MGGLMNTSMNRNKLNEAVMYDRKDDVLSMIQSGADFLVEDVKNACVSAIGYEHFDILEAIFSDKRYITISGDLLDEAARLGKVEAVKYLLTFKPDWTKCALALGTANKKGNTEICDLIRPFSNPPDGFPGKQ